MMTAASRPKAVVFLEHPLEFLTETEYIISLIFPQFDFALIRKVFSDIERLFQGEYPGYSRCTTRYHDLNHTMHCFLLVARLIHGASINGIIFRKREVALGLISALMHDTGYIQLKRDKIGTGGKFTLVHIERSIEFMEKYFKKHGFSLRDYIFSRDCLRCTGTNVIINQIKFESHEHELVGKILGTADLTGQMADRDYLVKLPFLFQEFKEGGVSIFNDELDLIEATPDFWEFTKQRFVTEYGNVDRFLRDHFRDRWGIDRNLDLESIEQNMKHLNFILKYHKACYRRYLSRVGIKKIISEMKRIEGTDGNSAN